MSKPNNPNAFPESCTNEGHRPNVDSGMTLRDYFASKAMEGIIASTANPNARSNPLYEINESRLSEQSYNIADAMLKQREL